MIMKAYIQGHSPGRQRRTLRAAVDFVKTFPFSSSKKVS